MRASHFLCVLAIAALPSFWSAAQAQTQNPSFNLLNHGRSAITQLYFTPAGDANWGRNRLRGGSIAPGASYAARRRIDGNCIFDIRVVFADGRIEDRRNLNTCTADDVAFGQPVGGLPGAVAKAPDDPSFRLINRSSQPIVEAFATPAGLGNWGQNRLDGPLPPQADKLVHVDKQGSCLFDLRVVFADHTARERHRTDLCRIADLPVP
jgi:hypothetical protein